MPSDLQLLAAKKYFSKFLNNATLLNSFRGIVLSTGTGLFKRRGSTCSWYVKLE